MPNYAKQQTERHDREQHPLQLHDVEWPRHIVGCERIRKENDGNSSCDHFRCP